MWLAGSDRPSIIAIVRARAGAEHKTPYTSEPGFRFYGSGIYDGRPRVQRLSVGLAALPHNRQSCLELLLLLLLMPPFPRLELREAV